jgi:TnpA family transposase
MPERHLLDVLKNVHHAIPYTRHFGPPSGADPKLPDDISRYLFTIFGYASELGATQTARHTQNLIGWYTLRRLNTQHITTTKLEAALRDVINDYARFELPFFWGSGQAAIADGTHIELLENNLLGAQHIRYGRFGGIAYPLVSNTYIALFSHFIACGVWEAVYILDGLLKNKSELQPNTLHADTHGQSEPVFGLASLLGIKLMPRMQTWNDVSLYRVDRRTTYQHIDRLLTQVVDWDLIERYWQDMRQVVLRRRPEPGWSIISTFISIPRAQASPPTMKRLTSRRGAFGRSKNFTIRPTSANPGWVKLANPRSN